ncbi:hypothetical protein D3P09_10895 [Paenibacillus pinisoli]|uniref:Uncharacterized protein n=1 Tax=Paenibacillus pinisoli TaxID=1276110 RepID=A0A3A6PNX0_9BACL|nr:hypothetical protein D3P09_10895 [Paenibacillus pinisoli]
MLKYFEPINTRVFNASAWLVIILAYVYPFRTVKDGWIEVGFPIRFLTIYSNWRTNLLASLSLNLLSLFLNMVIVYLLISAARSWYKRSKKS